MSTPVYRPSTRRQPARRKDCPDCYGSGEDFDTSDACTTCHGYGKVRGEK